MVRVEIINHPASKVRMLKREPRDFLRPAPVIQTKRLRIQIPFPWRALGRRDQIDPDLDVRLRRFRQEQLQVVPICPRVPHQPVIGGDVQLLQAAQQRLAVHMAIRAARLRIIIGEVER